ncbi:MAG TPA: acyl carrier protein [Polyangiaceae bacterium]|nr:acyl carrier protein [Polyangiaceae bacterium]
MTRSEILATILRLGRKIFDEEELSFDEATLFDDIDEWDSLNHVHMVVGMEKAFGIQFDLGELKRLVRVSDLIDIVERKRRRAGF